MFLSTACPGSQGLEKIYCHILLHFTSREYWYGYCWDGHVGKVMIWIFMSCNYIDIVIAMYCWAAIILILLLPRRESIDMDIVGMATSEKYWYGYWWAAIILILLLPRRESIDMGIVGMATSEEYWYGYWWAAIILTWRIATSGEYWYEYCWYGHVGRVTMRY